MKIYLTSFLESNNFGPGRMIGIANGNKPNYIKCDLIFKELIPSNEIMLSYNKECFKNAKKASKSFITNFTGQLDRFYTDVVSSAKEEKVTPQELLPFEEGDSLGSWERKEYTNYRKLIAPYLEKLGYEVVNN